MSNFSKADPTNLDVFFLLISGTLVFFMQTGFAMLCAGSVRQKNVKNLLLKNLLDACGGAFGFFTVGYAFAQGGGDNHFIGTEGKWFFLKGVHRGYDFVNWFWHFAFAATAATIVAGTVAERCKMQAYLCYSVMLTSFVYPVVNHSVWNANGFLSMNANPKPILGLGMIDFAGSGVVHMVGGATSLVAAIILGPRIGRFYDRFGNPLSEPEHFPPHSVSLQILGTFVLWIGWYGFNPGSTLGISTDQQADTAGLCVVTTTLSAAAGGVSALFTDTLWGYWKNNEAEYDIAHAMNGTLSGLVAITAGCSVVEPWAAAVIGIVSGWVYVVSSDFIIRLKIDDVVDAIPVHLFNGIWGCLAVGLFAEPSRTQGVYGNTQHYGLFYDWGRGSADSALLLVQCVGVLWIIGWTIGVMTPFFYILNYIGWFRVDAHEELVGLDISHHRGSAYDYSAVNDEDIEDLILQRAEHQGKVIVPPKPYDHGVVTPTR